MSKIDALRAMREAKYAANSARVSSRAAQPAPRATTPTPVAPKPVTPASAPKAATQPAEPVAAADELCGHRNMSGRTCTRERGHSAKSHRYS